MNTIKHLRVSRGLTQQELADILSVDVSSVSKWETGTVCPRPPLLIKMAGYFNCSVDSLLQDGGREMIG